MTPEEPVLFIKPETALCDLRRRWCFLRAGLGASRSRAGGAIGSTLRQATEEHVLKGLPAMASRWISRCATCRRK